MEGLQYFKFGVDKMPMWFKHLVGIGTVKIRRTDEGVLCIKYKDKTTGEQKEVIQGTLITNDMF